MTKNAKYDIIYLRDDKMKLITRNHYLNKLIDVKNTPDIKVITGVRRAGKSKLMGCLIQINLNT